MRTDEVKARIEAIRTEKLTRHEQALQEAAENEAAINEAAESMRAAAASGDQDGYLKAKKQKARAEESRDFFAEVVRQIENEPIITEQEYDALGAAVETDKRSDLEAVQEQLFEKCAEIRQIISKARQKENEQNSVLRELEELPRVINPDQKSYHMFGSGNVNYRQILERELRNV